MLLKEIEEEIPMDELEADIVKTVDYHDNVILPLENLCNSNDWRRASNSSWAELQSALWCEYTFKQTNVKVNRRDEPCAPVETKIWLWSINCHRSFEAQKKLFGTAPLEPFFYFLYYFHVPPSAVECKDQHLLSNRNGAGWKRRLKRRWEKTDPRRGKCVVLRR